jgi:enoyl-CoA hydratase
MNAESNIHCYTQGPLAFCVLGRPKQLNALTIAMNESMKYFLLKWKDDPSIQAVILSSSSPKAFCAGGDIKLAYTLGQQNPEEALSFFDIEYGINLLIATYPKPIIAYCQGITMGGGCGIGFHVSHAIAGDQIQLAMPETKIGLFPDIGASYELPRLKHHVGYYLGLTGNSIDQVNVMYCGLMRYGMDDAAFQQVLNDLTKVEWTENSFFDVDRVLSPYLKKPDMSCELARLEPWIEALFSAPSLKGLLHSSVGHSQAESDWRKMTIETLKLRSPKSLAMTFEAFKRGEQMTLEQVLKQDLKLAKICLTSQDFYRGVKACLIDRCEPKWERDSIEDYSDDVISQWFI